MRTYNDVVLALLRVMLLGLSPLVSVLTAYPLVGQSVEGGDHILPPPLSFDVVSIRPNNTGNESRYVTGQPDGVLYTNVTLKMLIWNAYDINPDMISGGPRWLDSSAFNAQVKVDIKDVGAWKKLTAEQQHKMLQEVLSDRFGLKVHTLVRTMPVYDLLVAKRGARLQEVASDALTAAKLEKYSVGPGSLNGTAIPLGVLTSQLEFHLHERVVDKTGLQAYYNMTLSWNPTELSANAPEPAADSFGKASLFSALQEQLGLQLRASKGPVKTLVVDEAHAPTAN